MAQTMVRLELPQEIVVEKLTKTGIYKTRSEVIRAGIMELGKQYKVFKNFKEIEDELAVRKMEKISEEIKKGKRRVWTEAEVKKKYGFK